MAKNIMEMDEDEVMALIVKKNYGSIIDQYAEQELEGMNQIVKKAQEENPCAQEDLEAFIQLNEALSPESTNEFAEFSSLLAGKFGDEIMQVAPYIREFDDVDRFIDYANLIRDATEIAKGLMMAEARHYLRIAEATMEIAKERKITFEEAVKPTYRDEALRKAYSTKAEALEHIVGKMDKVDEMVEKMRGSLEILKEMGVEEVVLQMNDFPGADTFELYRKEVISAKEKEFDRAYNITK
jgi:hypothetical protein